MAIYSFDDAPIYALVSDPIPPTTGTPDAIKLHMQAMNSLSICRSLMTAAEPCYLFALNHLAEAQKAIAALNALDLKLEG